MFGKSDWLDGTMSLVDYGHRGVPNVFLNAPLTSTGTWNAAHFKNPHYDCLFKQYVAAVDLAPSSSSPARSSSLLLDETPLIIAYFFDALSVTKKAVGGCRHHAAWARSSWTRRATRLSIRHPGGAAARRRRAHPEGEIPFYILKRFGLALITLWILSVIVFLAGQLLPGDPGRAILGPLRRAARVRQLDHQLGVDRPLADPVHGLVTSHPARRHGHVLQLPAADPAVHHDGARELAEAGRWWRS